MLETDCERIKEKAIILNGAEPSRTADLGENNPFWAAGSLINCVALAMYWNFSCNQTSHQWQPSAPTAKGGRSCSRVTKSWQSAVEQPQNTYWKQGEAGCLVLSIKPAALFKPGFSMISSLSTSNLYPEWSEGYQGTFIHASSWLGDMKSNSTTRWSPTKTSDIADIALFKYHIYIYKYTYDIHSIDFTYILNITMSHIFHFLSMLCMFVMFVPGFLSWYFAGPKCHVVAHSQGRTLWRFPRQGVGHLCWMLHAVSCSHSPRMVWPYRCQAIIQTAGGHTFLPQCKLAVIISNPYMSLPGQCMPMWYISHLRVRNKDRFWRSYFYIIIYIIANVIQAMDSFEIGIWWQSATQELFGVEGHSFKKLRWKSRGISDIASL